MLTVLAFDFHNAVDGEQGGAVVAVVDRLDCGD